MTEKGETETLHQNHACCNSLRKKVGLLADLLHLISCQLWIELGLPVFNKHPFWKPVVDDVAYRPVACFKLG